MAGPVAVVREVAHVVVDATRGSVDRDRAVEPLHRFPPGLGGFRAHERMSRPDCTEVGLAACHAASVEPNEGAVRPRIRTNRSASRGAPLVKPRERWVL